MGRTRRKDGERHTSEESGMRGAAGDEAGQG